MLPIFKRLFQILYHDITDFIGGNVIVLKDLSKHLSHSLSGCTVSSTRALVLKMQIYSNATEILGNNLSRACVILAMRNTRQSRNLYLAEMSCVGIHNHTREHTSNIYQPPGLTMCVMEHTYPHLILQLSTQLQINLLPSLLTSCNPSHTYSHKQISSPFQGKAPYLLWYFYIFLIIYNV